MSKTNLIEQIIQEEVRIAIKNFFLVQGLNAKKEKAVKKSKMSDEAMAKKKAYDKAWRIRKQEEAKAAKAAEVAAFEIAMNEKLLNEMEAAKLETKKVKKSA